MDVKGDDDYDDDDDDYDYDYDDDYNDEYGVADKNVGPYANNIPRDNVGNHPNSEDEEEAEFRRQIIRQWHAQIGLEVRQAVALRKRATPPAKWWNLDGLWGLVTRS